MVTLAASSDVGSSIAIQVSHDPSLEFPQADKVVEGTNWARDIGSVESYDFVVVDLPFGLKRKNIHIGDSSISVRGNWAELAKALYLVEKNGLCIAIVEPPAFGISEGPKFLEALENEGFYLKGVFRAC